MRLSKVEVNCWWVCLLVLLTPISVFAQSKKDVNKVYPFGEIQRERAPIKESASLNISIRDGHFVDPTGRTLFLRGINLGGDTKVPYSPNGASHIREGFFDGEEVSFVGRPFPIEEADVHFQRLKSWGFHFLRFLVTWEAIEHEAPGVYDTAYLAYVRALIQKADEYGINVIIDPHQDVWSRFSGGDGAPKWTFDRIGMDVTKFQETGAAIVHNTHGDPFPQMIWYTNNFKLACATMFTLFYGGNDFAPMTSVDGEPIQDFLQQHYINALVEVAKVVADLPNVIGFELMNEPSSGFIGIEDIRLPFDTEIVGDAPTVWQGILAGNGFPQEIERFRIGAVALKSEGNVTLNPSGISVWEEGTLGVWLQNGLAEQDSTGAFQLANPGYFAEVDGKRVDFNKNYYLPFAEKYAEAITAINPDWVICVDDILFPYPLELPDLKKLPKYQWMNGSHWYDDVTLVKKQYLPFLGFYHGDLVFGKKKVEAAYVKTQAEIIENTKEHFGNVPSLLGEFGIPFDMNKGKAFRTGNFKKQTKALDRSFGIAEQNLLNYTLWNYTASNTNTRGDNWNGEDLSIFSLSQQSNNGDLNDGGRALEAAIRPYPKKIAGVLTDYAYDYKRQKLTVTFRAEQFSEFPTEIFLPAYVYAEDFAVTVTSGRLAYDEEDHLLLYYPDQVGSHTIIVQPQ